MDSLLGYALIQPWSFMRNTDTLLGHSLPSTSMCSSNRYTKHLGLINRCCHGIYVSFVCTYIFQYAKLTFTQRNGRHPYQWRTGWQIRISFAFYLLRCQPLSRYFATCGSASDAESGFASICLRFRNMQQVT